MLRDRGLMRELLERARRSGYGTLCVTLDLPVQGRRERDLRNAFAVPFRPGLSTLFGLACRPRFLMGLSRAPVRFGNFGSLGAGGAVPVAQHVATLFDPSADWGDIADLRQSWSGRFVIKGLLHPEDARRAVAIGAEAIIVSNHGGRQLDGAPAAIRALPKVADAIGDGAEIILDGGVRRGVDILKALALGASACMIGRAFLWGLAAGGQGGVSRAIGILADELDNGMALLGVSSLRAVSADHLLASHVRPLG
jgi:L-lactate dehydrogenase (cytochrome)/(S)-mandelate dehydrogenase